MDINKNEIVKIKINMNTGLYIIVFRYEIWRGCRVSQTFEPALYYKQIREFIQKAKARLVDLYIILERKGE